MRLAVVGTGLIGASVGLAAGRAGFGEVAGWDQDPNTLEVAAERVARYIADDPFTMLRMQRYGTSFNPSAEGLALSAATDGGLVVREL